MRSSSLQIPSRARVLGLFAKWPARGTVKTRLAGDDAGWGVRVAHAFLLDTLQRLAVVDAYRVLAFAPIEREADFAAVASSRFHLTPQGEGDLGQRLSGFVEKHLQAGARTVVVVGTDSPTLPVEYIERAFTELENADVALGPATDGGYYLVGCGAEHPPLFENISWSSGRVLAETVATLADPHWRLSVLPPWYDVDTPDDWTMLRGHLAALRRASVDPGVPHTEALLGATL
ncbi:MAG TPA: TIGR04282 family arsenosugar biosynthesis glycosyltransferase [Gemmataceae bacterium]|nr:TIGR04282 family arsenosugar biosynthesis glycosyltransferase [Gemmataceae bacterium]